MKKHYGGDRRSRCRFNLDLKVSYRVISWHQVCDGGIGQTIDISSKGVAFTSERALKAGTIIELSVSWPVLLDKTCLLQLVATGPVVRSSDAVTAIGIERYEFRTQSAQALVPAQLEMEKAVSYYRPRRMPSR